MTLTPNWCSLPTLEHISLLMTLSVGQTRNRLELQLTTTKDAPSTAWQLVKTKDDTSIIEVIRMRRTMRLQKIIWTCRGSVIDNERRRLLTRNFVRVRISFLENQSRHFTTSWCSGNHCVHRWRIIDFVLDAPHTSVVFVWRFWHDQLQRRPSSL